MRQPRETLKKRYRAQYRKDGAWLFAGEACTTPLEASKLGKRIAKTVLIRVVDLETGAIFGQG